MKQKRLTIANFRGVAHGVIHRPATPFSLEATTLANRRYARPWISSLGHSASIGAPARSDEHHFHCGRYLDDNKEPIEVRIEAVLTDLPQEAQLRFHRHLRRWDDVTRDFADQDANGPADGDGAQKRWALPVIFVGRYDKGEDDFVGNTFFDHPVVGSRGQMTRPK